MHLAAVLLLSIVAPGADRVRVLPAGREVRGGSIDEATTAVVAVGIEDHVVCSGSVIAPRAVLTAAHCTWFPGLTVHVGSGPGLSIEVERVWRPMGAEPGRFTDDVAVLELVDEVDGVEPLAVATSGELSLHDPLRLVGFGEADDGTSGVRRTVSLPPSEVTSRTLTFQDAGASACRGDSGGPALGTGAAETIVAVASHGDPDCRRFAVFERVDTHADFIGEALDAIGEEPSAVGCRIAEATGRRGGVLASLCWLSVFGGRRPARRIGASVDHEL